MIPTTYTMRIHLTQRKAVLLTVFGLNQSTVARAFSTMTPSAASSLLKDPSLLDLSNNVQFQSLSSSKKFEVYNPAAPDDVVGNVPVMEGEETRRAIEQSQKVLPSWRDGTTASVRAKMLQDWSQLITENKEDLATIMSLESGKPLVESRGEVGYATAFLDFYSGEAVRATGAGGGMILPTPFVQTSPSTTSTNPRGKVMTIQQAVGVTGLITPWNFPIAMITRKVGPALAAGCTAIVKPSELTPLTAVALQVMADKAGIPPHVLQLM